MNIHSNHTNVLIVGPSGSGKHLYATQRIVNNLAEGRTVLVLDVGSTHAKLAELLGGTRVHFEADGSMVRKKCGTMPLTVLDLENLMEPVTFEQLDLAALTDNAFVLVDETWRVQHRVTNLWVALTEAMARGTSVAAVAQDVTEISKAASTAEMAVELISKGGRAFLGTLQPGQLYRHQDGGIYQFDSISKSTEDLSDLVNYTHIWPFEPGAKWSRPAHEWPSRFTPIAAADLEAARKVDRAAAQAAIASAKAARRAGSK